MTKAARHTKTASVEPQETTGQPVVGQPAADSKNMAQAEEIHSVSYTEEFAQMTKAMETMNVTLVEMSKGLSSRLDNLSQRIDMADASTKQMHTHTEEDRRTTNLKLEKLEKLLTQ